MCYDEKFFELFSLDSYIHVDIFSNIFFYTIIYYNEKLIAFSILKSIMRGFKTFCLVLYCIYIMFFYIVCFSLFLYILSYIVWFIHMLFFFFYCRILSDIMALFFFLLPKHNQFFYSCIKINDILIKYTPLFIVLIYSF